MKLTKLLPIATIGCVASIVTPLATSCGNGMYHFDGTNIYIPEAATAEMDQAHKDSGTPYKWDEATNLYFENLANNPNIFAEDMLCDLSNGLFNAKLNAAYEGANIDEWLDVRFDNVSANKDSRTISFEVKGSGHVRVRPTTNMKNGGTVVDSIELKHFEGKIENLPIVCDYDGRSTYACDWTIWHGIGEQGERQYYNPIDTRPLSVIMADTKYDSYNINISGKIDGVFMLSSTIINFNNISVEANKSNIKTLSNIQRLAIDLLDRFSYISQSYHLSFVDGRDNQ